MYKQCRILNKKTSVSYFGQIDTEFSKLGIGDEVEVPKELENEQYIKYENGKVVKYTPEISKEEQIKNIEKQFNIEISKTLEYKNKPFKISYCLQYQTFEGRYIDDVMTLRVWDATGKSYLDLNKADFVQLKLMLAERYEIAFQNMKLQISKIK